jgi:hypothetical protein
MDNRLCNMNMKASLEAVDVCFFARLEYVQYYFFLSLYLL